MRKENSVEYLKKRLEALEQNHVSMKKQVEQNSCKIRLIEAKLSEMEDQEKTDPLTGLLNRQTLIKHLDLLKCYPHGIIVMDVDNFKKINDSFGHVSGDLVLKEIGGIIKSSVRKGTKAYRYGGEEFIIIVPMDNEKDLISSKISERIRKKIAAQPIKIVKFGNGNENEISVTVSCGIAVTNGKKGGECEKANPKETLEKADKAMYYAKKLGKNMCICFHNMDTLKERPRKISGEN